jgi:hypothetical protein
MSARVALLVFTLPWIGGPPSPRLSKIAISQLVVPADFENVEPVKAAFDTLVNALLTEEGFAVIPSSETAAIWTRLVDSVQGYYDPIYGRIVEAKYRAVASGTLNELRGRFGIDGWLRLWIERAPVRWGGKKVEWDGHSEDVGGGSGTTVGLSLVVSVLDTLGREVYHGRGGIQQAVKFFGYQPQPLPPEQLLTDRGRNRQAVHLALDSLVHIGPHAQH